MEEQFNKLEELIQDEDKIVTVASYALTANIPYEQAQEVIDKYLEINKPSKNVYPTYILKGTRKDSKKFSITHVNDETLAGEEQLYENDCAVINFSIQKAKLIDYNVISLVEQVLDNTNNVVSGAIVGKNCFKRVLRKNVLPPLPAATIKGKSTILMKQINSLKSEVKLQENDDTKREGDEEVTKCKGQPSNSITSMFNKVAQKKKTPAKDDKTLKSKAKQTGGISNFLLSNQSKCKATEKEQIRVEKEADENKNEKDVEMSSSAKPDTKNVEKEVKKSDLFDSDTDDEILKDLHIQEEPVEKNKSKSTNKNNKSSQKKKRAKSDVGNDKSAKKRKRIIVEEDSESDDIFESDKSDPEEVIEKHDEPEPIKTEPTPLPPKNKRRKAVKKTYEDDEGYIVTQTEYVYETASEDENEPDNKILKKTSEPSKPNKLEKKKSNNSESEISPKTCPKSKKGAKKTLSGNQPTLMDFFKRK